MTKAVKQHGRVYTPDYLVKNILDFGYYDTENILQKHVIDNSCGDGAFLKEIVARYCKIFLAFHSDINLLKIELETYIHGIELDKEEWKKCIQNLNNVVSQCGIKDVQWNILNADTLTVDDFNGKMDFIFGNPPYVRVHNLQDSYDVVKKFRFAQSGMTDLYIVFFEIGFRMLSTTGRMCLITPSSWLNSKAGSVLRKYIIANNNLSGVVDLGHFQPFEATTYTLISRFENNVESIDYYIYDEKTLLPKHQETLTIKQLYFKDCFYFSKSEKLDLLKKVKAHHGYPYVTVKNGFATLADKIFISDFDFKEGTIDILKASTGKWSRCIYPYDQTGKPIPLSIFQKQKEAFQHLLANKGKLSKGRDIESDKSWYLFGRTQALKDVYRDKIAINTIIKDVSSIKLEVVPSGKGIYSGLYILTEIPFETIQELILSQDFITFVSLLKNYKSGGYYTFASKDLEQYLNYKLSERYGQSRISKGNLELF